MPLSPVSGQLAALLTCGIGICMPGIPSDEGQLALEGIPTGTA